MAGKGEVHSQANGEKAELAHLKPALQELLSAWECAHDVQSDPWQFAVETADLTALGLGKSGLRWLVRKGFAEHARELTRRGDAARLPAGAEPCLHEQVLFHLDGCRAFVAGKGGGGPGSPASLRNACGPSLWLPCRRAGTCGRGRSTLATRS